ncbi:MAG TPA: acyltransferase [Pyrinomonadaceae bacterium]|nr:acyltransferase [Pyrinomonadaceae bacterium]
MSSAAPESNAIAEKNRIDVLDFLRGIAALAVTLHHFANILDPGLLRSAAFYGQLGVQVFFVISGFIIPYSLYRGGYEVRQFPTFLLKRVTRLDPPYVVMLALIIVLGVFSWYFPFQRDLVFQISLPQVLLHLGYVNTFFGYPWLSDVFWTLAIEFQYYVLMGLVFPLVFSRRTATRLATFAVLVALSFVIPESIYVFYFITLFFMGIFTCQYRLGLIGRRQYAALLAVTTFFALATMGLPATLAGFAAVCASLFLQMRYAVFQFLGAISYSLYLVHSPIGRRALNVILRATGAESFGGKLVVIALATGVSIFAAYLLYRWVELPSQRWSQSFRYHRRRKREEVRPEELEQLNPAL